MPVARVRGVVKEGGHPMTAGWIEFIPTQGTIGDLRSARIRADGSFDADGVAVGTNAIRLVDVPVESLSHVALFTRPEIRWAGIVRPVDAQPGRPIEARLLMPFASPIRRDIRAETSIPLEIDVVEEARRFQADWNRKRAGSVTEAGEG
jgi:hypothetical protein